LQGAGADEAALAAEAQSLDALNAALAGAEAEALDSEGAHAQAREAEMRARGPLNEAERKAQQLETEVATLTKLLGSAADAQWPPVLDQINVAKGYEAALGAALGDDLDASTDPDAPAHCRPPRAMSTARICLPAPNLWPAAFMRRRPCGAGSRRSASSRAGGAGPCARS